MATLPGIYAAVVENNDDPEALGRIQVRFPDNVAGPAWARACLSPVQMRLLKSFVPPRLGDEVWIMFERGDPRHPVWIGCGWNAGTRQPPAYPEHRPF